MDDNRSKQEHMAFHKMATRAFAKPEIASAYDCLLPLASRPLGGGVKGQLPPCVQTQRCCPIPAAHLRFETTNKAKIM
jgi:hypothetical protein